MKMRGRKSPGVLQWFFIGLAIRHRMRQRAVDLLILIQNDIEAQPQIPAALLRPHSAFGFAWAAKSVDCGAPVQRLIA
jgi:hypothetical protein